ncbi:MAG TPA: F0F1 ATP synthase subunit B [Thermoanaerobaculia bacterium]|nr:F0F1 ATP synthase subunit B [Thermoanaerobaculia bacterium]
MMRRALFAVAGVAAMTMMAVPALAAEEGGEAPSLFAGDLGNSVWTLLIFVVVLVVLGKFAWGPILNTLQTRESFIREALEKAKHDREAAEARLKEYEQKLAAARGEASAIVDEGRRDADVVKRRIEAAAKEEADKMIERARREIQIATDTAIKELYTLSAKLATQLAAQVIGRELTPQDHQRLISEAISGIEGAGRN